MKTSGMKESKFLKKEDVGEGVLYTVTAINQQNVALPGIDPELKWCLWFEEADKPLVLNSTNIQLCERVFGSDETDDWVGKKIVLYTDHNISFQGKLVGGIRVRAPKITKTIVATRKTLTATGKPGSRAIAHDEEIEVPIDDSDIPF
jgi:hypothetical protein